MTELVWRKNHPTRRLAAWPVIVVLCAMLTAPASQVLCVDDLTGKTEESEKSDETTVDLTDLSLEDLMNIEVTIASRKPESVFNTASAVYVLTQEDIHRSGATNIPDALRLVPGLNVARTSGNEWAITGRGFNGVYANKLLVLIDGRSVYCTVTSGIFWDVQDVALEDIDRIEVIRGPGSAMWGANAVNGVINIITKSASDTQGTLVSETTGSVAQNISVVRYGAKSGKNGHYRVFGKHLKQGPFVDPMGNDTNDSYDILHGGFRADWNTSKSDLVTIQGDVYNEAKNETQIRPFLTEPYMRPTPYNTAISGGNLLGRWTRACSETSDFTLQVYYDRLRFNRPLSSYAQDALDLDFQHHVKLDSRHEVTWGLGYRYLADSIPESFIVISTPPRLSQQLISAFAQEDIALAPKLLRLTVGSKFERNHYTGFNIQPNIRLLWTPNSRQTGWAAVSRAVRTPSRVEEDVRYNMNVLPNPSDPDLPYLVSAVGNRGYGDEDVVAYELGYRTRKGERFSLDTTAFYNVYDRLRTFEPGTPYFEPSPLPHVVIPLYAANKMHVDSYGFELAANWRPWDRWRMVVGYTYLQVRMGLDPDSHAATEMLADAYNSPRNQFFLRSSADLPNKIEFDFTLRYVDKPPILPVSSYFALDLRMAWKQTDNLELSMVGRDLLSSRHEEFLGDFMPTPATEAPRSFYVNMTWNF